MLELQLQHTPVGLQDPDPARVSSEADDGMELLQQERLAKREVQERERVAKHEAHQVMERPYKAFYEEGQHVMAFHREGNRLQKAVVAEALSNGLYRLAWDDGTQTDCLHYSNTIRESAHDQIFQQELGKRKRKIGKMKIGGGECADAGANERMLIMRDALAAFAARAAKRCVRI